MAGPGTTEAVAMPEMGAKAEAAWAAAWILAHPLEALAGSEPVSGVADALEAGEEAPQGRWTEETEAASSDTSRSH